MKNTISSFFLTAALTGCLLLPGCGQTAAPAESTPSPAVTEAAPTPSPTPVPSDRELYEQAEDLLYTRQFEEARSLYLQLGSYEDSAEKAEFCVTYPESEIAPSRVIISEQNLWKSFEQGKIYQLGTWGEDKYTGLVYVPDEINRDTAFVQYYAGGGGSEDDYLWRPGVKTYCEYYAPNAVILFTNEPGITHLEWRNKCQYDLLRQIAAECGTILHDLSAVGSSNGAYTAMKLAADYYMNYGLKVKNVCTLDTACFWESEVFELTPEEAAAVKEAGTVFYLFEEAEFTTDLTKPALRPVLDGGIETYAVLCRSGNHDYISRNAYTLGVFSFSIAPDRYSLPDWQYRVLPLNAGMESFASEPYDWPEQPEADTRQVY